MFGKVFTASETKKEQQATYALDYAYDIISADKLAEFVKQYYKDADGLHAAVVAYLQENRDAVLQLIIDQKIEEMAGAIASTACREELK